MSAMASNHQRLGCLLNRLFRRRTKKASKLRVTGLCEVSSPVTGGFPAPRPVAQKMSPFDDVIMRIPTSGHWLATVLIVPGQPEANPGHPRDAFYQHGTTLIPTWISNHRPSKVWDEITNPFPNFNGATDEITYPFPTFNCCTVEVWEWISNFIPQFTMDVITFPCWD